MFFFFFEKKGRRERNFVLYPVGEQVDDLEGVPNDADGQELLAVVPAVPHEGVGQTLSDGALEEKKSILILPSPKRSHLNPSLSI